MSCDRGEIEQNVTMRGPLFFTGCQSAQRAVEVEIGGVDKAEHGVWHSLESGLPAPGVFLRGRFLGRALFGSLGFQNN